MGTELPSRLTTVNHKTGVAAVSESEDAAVALSVVEGGAAPDAELREFLRGEGVSDGPISQDESGAVQTARARFDAASEESSLRGEVAFMRYGGLTYRVIGYSMTDKCAGYEREI
jgi:hypothetical protein